VTNVLLLRDHGVELMTSRGTRRKPNPIDIHVGSRIRQLRIMRGLSQGALAERVHVTFQQIQKYEKGVNRVGASRMLDLSITLGVTIDYFYQNMTEKDAPEPHTKENFLVSKESIELNAHFAKITDEAVRSSVIAMVAALSKGNVEK
jgi:transcriptional regulator with XRE-family HTH domain